LQAVFWKLFSQGLNWLGLHRQPGYVPRLSAFGAASRMDGEPPNLRLKGGLNRHCPIVPMDEARCDALRAKAI
jgi:hypothetical protein